MSAPSVELGFNPTDLRPRDLPRAGAFLGSPADAIEAALAVTRASMVDQMRTQVRGLPEPTHAQLVRIADLAWQSIFWKFRKISAPVMADAYVRAYARADAGDVPISVIYDLADKHAEKIGDYFHASSRDGLAEGFNTLVNRQLPAKAAADRVLDAYGLTSRQMRGYTAQKFNTPISDVMPRALKAKAREYIDKSFTTRIRKLSRQEEHNIDEQAKQYAWMWLQDKGRLTKNAQKMWITAHDERVCPVCGPLHGQKVKVGEQFKTSRGEFWTPGLHPNCRCVVRLIENTFTKNSKGIFAKAGFDPRLHPRGGPQNKGQFRRKPPAAVLPVKEAEENRPVIETPKSDILENLQIQPEEKISLSEGKVSLGMPEKVSLGRKVSLGHKVSLGGKVSLHDKTSLTDKTSLANKVSLSREEIADRIQLAPAAKIALTLETQKFLLDSATPYTAPKVGARKLYHRPTIMIQDVAGKPYPAYAVVEDDTPTDGWTYQLNHDIYFTPHLGSVASRVVEQREEKIVDAIDDVVQAAGEDPLIWHPHHGTEQPRFTADITFEDIAAPIRWLANGSDPKNDETSTIVWVDSTGGRHPEFYKYSQIIEMMGDRAKHLDLEVKVMRLDEAHDSRKGQTVHHKAGTYSGHESWITEGDYTVKRTKRKVLQSEHRKIGTTIVYLDPDIETKELPTILGGEWPQGE